MSIYISVQNILVGIFSFASLLIFATWLLKQWVGVRIDKSIQHFYDKELEDYKNSRIRREKAELISRLFSLWIKYRTREKKILNKRELIDHYEELNRMSLELALWIEDVELLNDVMLRLQNADRAKSIHNIIGQVRHLLLEKKDCFDPENIVLWPIPSEYEEIFDS